MPSLIQNRRDAMAKALRNFGESGRVIRHSGCIIGVAIPSGHPEFDKIMQVMGDKATRCVDDVEHVREFLLDQYFVIDSTDARFSFVPLDQILAHLNTWLNDRQIISMATNELDKILTHVGIKVNARDQVEGIIHKGSLINEVIE